MDRCGGSSLTQQACRPVLPCNTQQSQQVERNYTVRLLQRPYDNWDTVLFDCTGQVSLCILLQLPCSNRASSYIRLLMIAEMQSFDTVMQAIDSNNPRWGINSVTLVLQRPQ